MKIQLERCPFCGYSEFIEARQAAPETYVTAQTILGQPLYHTICRNCGSVVRSFVEVPEKLLRKKDRRIKD